MPPVKLGPYRQHNYDATVAMWRQQSPFITRDIRALCPQTPKGSISALASQLKDDGLIVVAGKRGNSHVLQVAPRWRAHRSEKRAAEVALERVFRKARSRFAKAARRKKHPPEREGGL